MPKHLAAEIEAEALREIAAEEHKNAVAAAKARILERRARPWWRVLFPFRIKIERID